jgi:hypothetical protein
MKAFINVFQFCTVSAGWEWNYCKAFPRSENYWRKICTSRQAHSKPKKLASHAKRSQDVPVNFPWKLTKDKVVKFQSLELAGWYQTVPYLWLESQVRWHIAMKSYLPAYYKPFGSFKVRKVTQPNRWHKHDDRSVFIWIKMHVRKTMTDPRGKQH